MAPTKNGRLLFNEIPTGYPEPGKTTIYDDSQTINLDTIPVHGGVLVKTLVFSIDPYLRGKMRVPEIESHSAAFVIGEPLSNFGVGVVLRSETSEVKAGDHIYGVFPFQEYFTLSDLAKTRVLTNEHNIPWSTYVGVSGQTAYYGWKEFASPQAGDIVFVTAGAGPVGSFVIQLAKAAGLKVIASAGSGDKVAFLQSIGTDVAFNYKTEDTSTILKQEGPVNIYWDNVGGESFDAALGFAAKGARFIVSKLREYPPFSLFNKDDSKECGMISWYNGQPQQLKNLRNIYARELKIFGLLVGSYHQKYREEFYEEVPRWIADGTIKYTEDITKGLQYAGHAILDVQTGKNKGKSVVLVAEE
ncbi:hypothetical protein EIP86_002964 [Pleurotus ostreatoroseus]|nr:hypothetical protein EIP86_002964 [Pleurotus ostreatoroseus]